jgi:hypothetical protein
MCEWEDLNMENYTNGTWRGFWVSMAVMPAVVSCGSPMILEMPSQPEPEAVTERVSDRDWYDAKEFLVAPWKRQFTLEQLEGVVIEEERILFPLEGNQELLTAARGEILWAPTGNHERSFARRVQSVVQVGETIVINTSQANLGDLFLKLDYRSGDPELDRRIVGLGGEGAVQRQAVEIDPSGDDGRLDYTVGAGVNIGVTICEKNGSLDFLGKNKEDGSPPECDPDATQFQVSVKPNIEVDGFVRLYLNMTMSDVQNECIAMARFYEGAIGVDYTGMAIGEWNFEFGEQRGRAWAWGEVVSRGAPAIVSIWNDAGAAVPAGGTSINDFTSDQKTDFFNYMDRLVLLHHEFQTNWEWGGVCFTGDVLRVTDPAPWLSHAREHTNWQAYLAERTGRWIESDDLEDCGIAQAAIGEARGAILADVKAATADLRESCQGNAARFELLNATSVEYSLDNLSFKLNKSLPSIDLVKGKKLIPSDIMIPVGAGTPAVTSGLNLLLDISVGAGGSVELSWADSPPTIRSGTALGGVIKDKLRGGEFEMIGYLPPTSCTSDDDCTDGTTCVLSMGVCLDEFQKSLGGVFKAGELSWPMPTMKGTVEVSLSASIKPAIDLKLFASTGPQLEIGAKAEAKASVSVEGAGLDLSCSTEVSAGVVADLKLEASIPMFWDLVLGTINLVDTCAGEHSSNPAERLLFDILCFKPAAADLCAANEPDIIRLEAADLDQEGTALSCVTTDKWMYIDFASFLSKSDGFDKKTALEVRVDDGEWVSADKILGSDHDHCTYEDIEQNTVAFQQSLDIRMEAPLKSGDEIVLVKQSFPAFSDADVTDCLVCNHKFEMDAKLCLETDGTLDCGAEYDAALKFTGTDLRFLASDAMIP